MQPAMYDRSIADQIAGALAERIVSGGLAPGLPIRQDQVAAEFRTSHVPVREAFRKLEAQGLLISEPRRGVRVAPLDPSALIEVTEMRAALELLALRYAFSKLDSSDLAAAEDALVEGEGSREIAVWEAANRRFHGALMNPCAMPRLLATIGDLQQVAARYLYATWQNLDWQPRSATEHRQLLQAVREGDLERAQIILREHILAAGMALHRMLSDTP